MAEFRPESTEPFRFGVFEVDPSTRELRKHGARINLQDQPFAVLLIFLEKPGSIVTKEELQARLWPADTFVEFDKGIYNAMKRLRETLGDDAEAPRYIETVPRRGYRFIAPVERRDGAGKSAELRSAPEPAPRSWDAKWWAVIGSVFTLLVIVVSVKLAHSPPIPKVVDTAQITKDGQPKNVSLKLLTDGTRLYFQEGASAGPMSTVPPDFVQKASLVQVSIHGGETAKISLGMAEGLIFDISPTRPELLVGGPASPPLQRPLWIAPLPAGSPRRAGDVRALDACWSADGNQLAFVGGPDLKQVFIVNRDGTNIRKLADLDRVPYWIQFSPDGTRLRFSTFTVSGRPEDWDIMELRTDGGGLRRLPIHGCCGKWSADGNYYFYQTSRDIWVLPEQRNIWGKSVDTPIQLTTGPLAFGAPTPGADGKHLFVVGNAPRIELVRHNQKSGSLIPFLGGISGGELEVSPDGQWVVYTTFPDSNLWRSKLDGSERLQLTFAPINAHEPRWSPDGKQILFTDVPRRMFRVPADGGQAEQVMPKGEFPDVEVGAGFWLPKRNWIAFVMGSDNGALGGYAIYRMNLDTQELSKVPGSDGLWASRGSRDGRYIIASNASHWMLFDSQTEHWTEFLDDSYGAPAWSHDDRFVYMERKNRDRSSEIVRISVPDGKVESVLELKDVTLGGYWPGWISLLPDDSALLMLDKSTQEIYRLDLQYR
jgi:DNA-binding winged helix-turn-helix (wHTH) protein/Tol biopolymer transport system component